MIMNSTRVAIIGCAVTVNLVAGAGCAPYHPGVQRATQEPTTRTDARTDERPEPMVGSVIIQIPEGAMGCGARAFGEGALRVTPGTQVTWINRDQLPHT